MTTETKIYAVVWSGSSKSETHCFKDEVLAKQVCAKANTKLSKRKSLFTKIFEIMVGKMDRYYIKEMLLIEKE